MNLETFGLRRIVAHESFYMFVGAFVVEPRVWIPGDIKGPIFSVFRKLQCACVGKENLKINFWIRDSKSGGPNAPESR